MLMRLRRTNAPRQRGGWTYIELVITVAVVGILAAIAAPRFARAQDGAALAAAARRLAAELTAVRQRAIVSRTKATVRFGRTTGGVTVSGIDTTRLSCEGGVIDLSQGPYGATISRTSFASDQVSFDGFGTPTSSGEIQLVRGGLNHIVSISKGGALSWE